MSTHTDSPYMTLKETAAHYRVHVTSVRFARGPLCELRHVKLGKRTLILRESVEALDAKLRRQSSAASDGLRLLERRRA